MTKKEAIDKILDEAEEKYAIAVKSDPIKALELSGFVQGLTHAAKIVKEIDHLDGQCKVGE